MARAQAQHSTQISADRLLREKSLSRLSQICKGEKFWNHKVENFFLSVWKKPFVMNGSSGALALRREQARGGEISRLPLALRLDVNIYYVCLFSPRRWLSAKLAAAGSAPARPGLLGTCRSQPVRRPDWFLLASLSLSRRLVASLQPPRQQRPDSPPAAAAGGSRNPQTFLAPSHRQRSLHSFLSLTSLAPSLPTLAWPLSCDGLGLIAGGATEISAPGV